MDLGGLEKGKERRETERGNKTTTTKINMVLKEPTVGAGWKQRDDKLMSFSPAGVAWPVRKEWRQCRAQVEGRRKGEKKKEKEKIWC